MMVRSIRGHQPLITFVVLHYNSIEYTHACVASLLNQRGVSLHIILVDNGSTNGSGRILAEQFSEDPRVTVILHEPNIGYARGVNLGYRHARKELGSTYICLSNNDVVYVDPHLVEKVCDVFERERCDVLGPAIYVPGKNIYQNPRWDRMLTVDEVDRLIHRYRSRKLRLQFGLGREVHPALRAILRKSRLLRPSPPRSARPPSQWKAQLHGATVFFGPRFIAGREYGMNPATMFSYEMDILCLECEQAGYSLYYCDEIEVTHYAHATIKPRSRKQRRADIAYLDHQIASASLFRKMLEAQERGLSSDQSAGDPVRPLSSSMPQPTPSEIQPTG